MSSFWRMSFLVRDLVVLSGTLLVVSVLAVHLWSSSEKSLWLTAFCPVSSMVTRGSALLLPSLMLAPMLQTWLVRPSSARTESTILSTVKRSGSPMVFGPITSPRPSGLVVRVWTVFPCYLLSAPKVSVLAAWTVRECGAQERPTLPLRMSKCPSKIWLARRIKASRVRALDLWFF